MGYAEVIARITEAAGSAGRSQEDITLVAVSKTKSVDEIARVYEQGHRDFGENRAQELAAKAPQLPQDIRWHFVGALQSNKVAAVRSVTHLLHSMDRRSLAKAWLKGRGLPPPVLLQVNVGDEEQKSGVGPNVVAETLTWLKEVGIDVRGLMALPPIPEHPEESRPYFRQLRSLRESAVSDHPEVRELSMGMTDDYEIAIQEGASIIRVGRAIFGPRN